MVCFGAVVISHWQQWLCSSAEDMVSGLPVLCSKAWSPGPPATADLLSHLRHCPAKAVGAMSWGLGSPSLHTLRPPAVLILTTHSYLKRWPEPARHTSRTSSSWDPITTPHHNHSVPQGQGDLSLYRRHLTPFPELILLTSVFIWLFWDSFLSFQHVPSDLSMSVSHIFLLNFWMCSLDTFKSSLNLSLLMHIRTSYNPLLACFIEHI